MAKLAENDPFFSVWEIIGKLLRQCTPIRENFLEKMQQNVKKLHFTRRPHLDFMEKAEKACIH